MRTAIISDIKDGMATVVYSERSGDASNPMPVFVSSSNARLRVGDRVVVASLNGKKDGIVLGKYWNPGYSPETE